ncbi:MULTISPECIES: type I 3-dehydroquinate dehydratase [Clostridium]|uniref:3-dehydroquinate dehydratase n=1 Tax=Clostridium saccharoperbutylacetonicum N1-4(HMT) TaxID=931276 RepID=M1MSA0_9CLOT|nr:MULTISPECIES: type I 3-dehydroquinate dehydratase [Clostridium]AGF59033.1 3-dehydroquinate dehydratase AroD [Clostridium saccharoperbutylacetonicum N1-4(HMT)]AQR97702.1 3-dehydroquinate dehydratase [Clostridium saccharoperbutylacetonicum]NRT60179.1 3-dehydroquinate dehydratase-1 [Clostridium saccharoperbutylacetonicum]NSB23491.1 3-dehydroquinate dehydratase-1 [Clostridium saccharoperbutylacetonicum]NSB33590.1 3-dehydroquinate dehydratase-1 [Clostridium saccharoperbutylacetonicum]
MKKTVKVRNVVLGEGTPKICVPIVGRTKEELIEEVEALKDISLDVVEWRVDYYENVEDIERVKELLVSLRKLLSNTPILFTFRSKKEGGEKEVSTNYYAKLNKEIAATRLVDLIDVELFTGDEIVKDIVAYAHDSEVKVVMSNHDFFKTPVQEEIVLRLRKMQELGADLPKIAVMPQNKNDVLVLLSATNEMVENYAEGPIITMSMAGTGVISRLAGEVFGSALTFGAAKKASAPGQIGVADLRTVLNILHNSIK